MTSVLVGHPSPPVADGLAGALREGLELDDVRAVSTGAHVLAAVAEATPDVVLLDAALDPGHEVSVCERLAGESVPVVMLTAPGADNHLELLAAGAQGITVATDGFDGVVRAVRTVLLGHTYVPPHLLGSVLRELIVLRRQQPDAASAVARLSARERQVLGLLGAGADHVEIADRLTISPNTAKTHINRILNKLDVRSRVEAASLAVAYGIAPIEDGDTA